MKTKKQKPIWYRVYAILKNGKKKISFSYGKSEISGIKTKYMNDPKVKHCWIEYQENKKWCSGI